VILFVVIVITLGLHRPNIDPDKVLILVILMAAMWFSDRLARGSRLIINSINNEATVYALPNSGTRITLKKPLLRARPGKRK
jgi:hypothetical protein